MNNQPDMPTGPNVLTPLHEFKVIVTDYVRYTDPLTGEVVVITIARN